MLGLANQGTSRDWCRETIALRCVWRGGQRATESGAARSSCGGKYQLTAALQESCGISTRGVGPGDRLSYLSDPLVQIYTSAVLFSNN